MHANRTPMIVGAQYAIDKQFFREIGEFDPGMHGWGGENMELPIRVNMPHIDHYTGKYDTY